MALRAHILSLFPRQHPASAAPSKHNRPLWPTGQQGSGPPAWPGGRRPIRRLWHAVEDVTSKTQSSGSREGEEHLDRRFPEQCTLLDVKDFLNHSIFS